DHHEAEMPLPPLRVAEPELIGKGRGEDRVSELLLLAAGLARGIAIQLALRAVRPPALLRRELEPLAHVRHFRAPARVELRLAFPAVQAFDERFHLQELLLGVELAALAAAAD